MKQEDKTFFEFKIDVKSALPVYEQVKRAIKLAILSQRLKEGEKLMSLRDLALKLQINPNTIIKIYTQLEVEGYVYSRPGAGYFVKVDKEKLKKERFVLFEKETQDYIAKVVELGYSFDDILEIMKRYFNRENGAANLKNINDTGGSNA